ncbi:MAG TPA: ribosome biogenesis GTP-binding protein YihA/YsxC [Cytophagaceae bacterium]|jgi:GTP-binding protein|nr:ribosome biogenesis GTP-binding protein YihA/YsxC [Cytophagaceae bacterium]
MLVKKALFVCSYDDYKKCPTKDTPEFAFIGRSNVGKSSLINLLTNNSKLAKTSSTPGKTQTINFFAINDEWNIVDLPGYGWARVSKTEKSKWDIMNMEYMLYREQLQLVFVLIDSRLDPQPIDLEFIQWVGEQGIPFSLVFTKADKQTRNKTGTTIAKFTNELYKTWDELPPIFVTSAEMGTGKDELLDYISDINRSFKASKKI